MIEDQLTSLTFLMVVLFLTILEKNRLNTLVTPFTVTAWPFVIISILVNGVLVYIDFKPFTMRAQLFVLVNLIILWIVGYLINFYSNLKDICNEKAVQFDDIFKKYISYEWLIFGIAWFAISVIFRRVSSLLNQYGGFAFVGDPRFENMMSFGFAAHMGEVCKICFILLGIFYKYSKRKILVLITLLALFIALASLQVKYHLLWVLIMLFIYKILEMPVSKQWRALLWTGTGVLVVMNLFWILLTIAWKTFSFTGRGIWKFLFEHTMLYITGGPIICDRWLDYANIKPEKTMLVVFQNIKNVIIGNPLRVNDLPLVNIGFLPISSHSISNVGTAYGVYFIIGGWPFTIFMTTILSIIYYFLYYLSIKRTNPFLIFLNILCLTLSALTFFSQYFTLLSLYETIMIFSIMIFIFQILNYLKSDKKTELQCNDS